MAIETNAAIHFWGTEDTITSTGGSTTAGSFTQASSTAWVNDDDAPMAAFLGIFTFGTAPTAGGAIHLYARLMDVNSTNDEQAPASGTTQHYLGSFIVYNTTSAQYIRLDPVGLPNAETSQNYEFYIENGADQTISANWSLLVTPMTIGPHA